MARAKARVPTPAPSRIEVDAARWRTILDTARDAIICIDSRGRITIFNRSAEEIFGFRSEEVVGANVNMLMPSPYREEHDRYIETYRRTGEARAIGRIRSVHARRKSGETFPIELSVSEARVRDEVVYSAIIRDVSERDRAERSLGAQHAVTRVLAGAVTFEEAMPALVEGVCSALGCDRGELWTVTDGDGLRLRCTWPEVVPDRGGTASGAPDALVAESSRCGEPVWIDGSVAFPISAGGQVAAVMRLVRGDQRRGGRGLVETFRAIGTQIGDFVQRKRSEQALRELERLFERSARQADLGAIAAKITHDLGNPLASISMQAQLLVRRARKAGPIEVEAVTGPATMIASEVQRLAKMIQEFKDFANHHRLAIAPIAIRMLVDRVVSLWRPVASERAIALRLDAGRGLPTIHADEGKLRRVLDNLMKNAIEAIDRGPGTIAIGAGLLDGETLRISVSDSGPGVAEDRDVFRLFETTKETGSGLGLTIAREIAIAHGGELSLERLKPHGTSFHLDLPLRLVKGRQP